MGDFKFFTTLFSGTILAATVVLTPMAPMASASPILIPVQQSTFEVRLNETQIAQPSFTVNQGTIYMSVDDIFLILSQMNLPHAWDGSTLWIGSPMNDSGKDSSNASTEDSSIAIRLKGKLFATVSGVSITNSGQKETYLPIWYMMNALDRIGAVSQWDG